MTHRRISVMGSTGSIGVSTLAVATHANAQASCDAPAFSVEALAGGGNVDKLIAQAKAVRPAIAIIADETKYETLKAALQPLGIETAAGDAAIVEAATRPCDRVMAAIVGVAGLASTHAALKAGNDVVLANKESMVCASDLLKAEAAQQGAKIVPVDSEHNAMFQVMERHEDIEKLILTASGGPFLNTPYDVMVRATPEEAMKHPRWSMGAKICIDSASLMNKALEFIEAACLFDMGPDQIDVVIHPQSIVHSLVAYRDASVLAQLGVPDMRTPIAHALSWPERRIETDVDRLNLAEIANLEFRAVDPKKFPAIDLARGALAAGGAMPAILNCANEAAVSAFMSGACGFLDISWIVSEAMSRFASQGIGTKPAGSLEDVVEFDRIGRALAAEMVREVQMKAQRAVG